MSSQNDERQPSMLQDMKQSFKVFHAICSYLCVPLAVVMSKGGKIGERYVGFPALIGLGLQLVIVALAGGPTGDVRVLVMCGLTCFALLGHRLHGNRVRRNGFRCHSMYTGEWTCPGNEVAVKGVIVPTIALLIGLLIHGFAPGAGLWLMLASVSQAVCVEMSKQEIRAQAQAQLDARYDQDAVARQREEMR